MDLVLLKFYARIALYISLTEGTFHIQIPASLLAVGATILHFPLAEAMIEKPAMSTV